MHGGLSKPASPGNGTRGQDRALVVVVKQQANGLTI
jgi:hypothetical protein